MFTAIQMQNIAVMELDTAQMPATIFKPKKRIGTTDERG
jgi:hypothetical protein